MKQALAVATVLLGLGAGGTGHAAPKPINVWLYGDGQSTRMYSEMSASGFGLPSSITVVSKAVNSTGPEGLDSKVYLEFLANPNSRPDVVHIGYAASASSYINCAYHGIFGSDYHTTHYDPASGITVKPYQDVALAEATAIKNAATVVTNFGKKVLLTKGTGSPAFFAITPCLNDAVAAVTWDLAILAPQYPWVDYSGYTAAAAAPVEESLKFNPYATWLWQTDAVHVSCDKAHFMVNDPYSIANCVTIANETQRQTLLGAWKVAKTTLKAYKYFQTL
jgi:hypothetical protein